MSRQNLYLVDASIYVFRAYFSIPDNFVSKQNESINAVYGYANFLVDLLKKSPQEISVAFDESLNTCFRNEIYPEYKANRELPDSNLHYQFEQCKRLTALLGLHYLSLERYEADDIIGTLAKLLGGDKQVTIVTRDKDLGQLLRKGDQLWDFAANVYTDEAGVFEKFGVTPSQIADFLALAGDTVDNIPGAPGIGGKSAAALLAEFQDLETLLNETPRVSTLNIRGAKRMQKILEEHEASIRLYRQITGIDCDIPLDISTAHVSRGAVDELLLAEFCEEMNFGEGLLNRMKQTVL